MGDVVDTDEVESINKIYIIIDAYEKSHDARLARCLWVAYVFKMSYRNDTTLSRDRPSTSYELAANLLWGWSDRFYNLNATAPTT